MGPIQNNPAPADDQIERLTSFRGNASGLTSSPQKNEIAWTGTHEGNSEIYSMNLDSSTVNNVTKHPAADYGPQFSPDGTKLLFTSRRAKDHEDPSATSWSQDKIFVSNTDGTGTREIAPHAWDYRWSPGGDALALCNDKDIQVVSADGKTGIATFKTAEPQGKGNLSSPRWSPKGDYIAYTDRYQGGGGSPSYLTVASIGGKTPAESFFLYSSGVKPSWSPEGDCIAFFNERTMKGRHDLTLYDVSSGETACIKSFKTIGEFPPEPVWSNDGKSIAFHDGGTIKLINRDGSDAHDVVKIPADIDDLTWTSDGKHVVFLSNLDGTSQVYAVSARARNAQRIKGVKPHASLSPSKTIGKDGITQDTSPSWSPDGSTIAFSRNTDKDGLFGTQSIYVMEPDGSAMKKLTTPTAQGEGSDKEPSWSPDGKTILFSSDRPVNDRKGQAIFAVDSDGTHVRNLTVPETKQKDMEPCFSPDGNKIAFTRVKDSNYEIFVMNADGSGQVNISQHPSEDLDPAWSPDNKELAFASMRDGETHQIYVMNADGTNVRKLTVDGFDSRKPTWSPDGSTIFFLRGGHFNGYALHAMNRDGSDLQRLGPKEINCDGYPAISPDGATVVTVATGEERGATELHLQSLDGENPELHTLRMKAKRSVREALLGKGGAAGQQSELNEEEGYLSIDGIRLDVNR